MQAGSTSLMAWFSQAPACLAGGESPGNFWVGTLVHLLLTALNLSLSFLGPRDSSLVLNMYIDQTRYFITFP